MAVDEIIQIHEKLIQKTSGMSGLRDFGMLESAVGLSVANGSKRSSPGTMLRQKPPLTVSRTGTYSGLFGK